MGEDFASEEDFGILLLKGVQSFIGVVADFRQRLVAIEKQSQLFRTMARPAPFAKRGVQPQLVVDVLVMPAYRTGFDTKLDAYLFVRLSLGEQI